MPKAGTADRNPSPPQPSRHTHIQIWPPHLEIPKREALQKTETAKTAPSPTDIPAANAEASAPYTNTSTQSSPSPRSPPPEQNEKISNSLELKAIHPPYRHAESVT